MEDGGHQKDSVGNDSGRNKEQWRERGGVQAGLRGMPRKQYERKLELTRGLGTPKGQWRSVVASKRREKLKKVAPSNRKHD